MDGVIVDLASAMRDWFEKYPHLIDKYKNHPDHIPGLFRYPLPLNDSVDSIKKLHESGKYELFILTTAPWGNPESLTDKRYWLEKYFLNLFHKRMITTHRKDLLLGDYLIDDRTANGAGEFSGELLKFGWDYKNNKWNDYPDWGSILKKLL